jgi:putative ABC transport system ATP-binding protein
MIFAVETRELNKSYKLDETEVIALAGVSVQLPRNRMTVLSGPSGSGKTTLLNMIGGIDQPDKGYVLIDGQDIGALSDDALSDFRARHIGTVFQNFNLLPVLTAAENVEYPLWKAKLSASERARRIAELLDAVGLSQKASRMPGQLSGGERQRVAIARAFAAAPSLILADEPTANLDSRTGAAIIELMQRMRRERGVSLIVSSHDPQVLEAADERVSIRDGRVVAQHRVGKEGVTA